LLEFAAGPLTSSHHRNDSGPDNIKYWPWIDAQVLVVDDVGPLIAAQPQGVDKLVQFKALLAGELQPVADILATCHTIWVIGDLRPAGSTQTGSISTIRAPLDQFARAIVDYCGGQAGDQLVIDLADREEPERRKGPSPVQVTAVRAV
jgi:hypothetical protein